eukprot:403358782
MQTVDKSLLFNSENPQKDSSSKTRFSKRNTILSACSALAVGLIVNQSLSTQVKSGSNELVKNGFLQSLWMDLPQSSFTWKKIPSLKVGQSSNKFIDLRVSPSGDIYGTVSQQMFDEEVKRGYLYSANSSDWSKAFSKFQFEGIRFDNYGNFYLLDQKYNVYAKNNTNEIILNNIHDFQISSSNVFHAITENQMDTRFGNETSDIDIRVYSASEYKKVQLLNDEPLLLTQNGSLSGYTNYHECLSDFSVGIDRSIWALNCSEDNSTGSELLKWNALNQSWDQIEGIKGVKISAYNEISVAVLDVFGNISLSQNNQQPIQPPSPNFNISSVILDDAEKQSFVLGLLPKDQGYNEAVLCYRHETGDVKAFHAGCDNQGPTLVVGVSIQKQIFGGYASKSWISENFSTCVVDKDAFIYSYEQKLKLAVNPNSTCALRNYALVGPKFGDNGGLMFWGNSMLIGPADQYLVPNDASQKAKEFWGNKTEYNIKTYEVFILKK